MIGKMTTGFALATCLAGLQLAVAPAASAAALKVKVNSVKSGEMIPTKYGFCMPAAQGHLGPGPDISPPVSWSKGPKGTQSYAVILTDTNSPKTDRDKMNKEGMTVPKTAERQTFYHWILVDIPADVRALKEGHEFDGARGARQAGDGACGRQARPQYVHRGHRLQRCAERQILWL